MEGKGKVCAILFCARFDFSSLKKNRKEWQTNVSREHLIRQTTIIPSNKYHQKQKLKPLQMPTCLAGKIKECHHEKVHIATADLSSSENYKLASEFISFHGKRNPTVQEMTLWC